MGLLYCFNTLREYGTRYLQNTADKACLDMRSEVSMSKSLDENNVSKRKK